MMRLEFSIEDAMKVKKAHDSLHLFIERLEREREKYGYQCKPSAFITEAYQCLSEVLYGE